MGLFYPVIKTGKFRQTTGVQNQQASSQQNICSYMYHLMLIYCNCLYIMVFKVWLCVSLCRCLSLLTQCEVVYLRRKCDINQCRVVCVYIGLG